MPHCRVQSRGEINVMIVPQPGCNNSIAILTIVFCHILFFVFFNAVLALTSGGFRIVSDTLVIIETYTVLIKDYTVFLPEKVGGCEKNHLLDGVDEWSHR